VVVLASYLILNTVNPSLVNLGGVEVPVSDIRGTNDAEQNPSEKGEGECFPTDTSEEGLGGTNCTIIGTGWFNYPSGCFNSCASGTICCICNLGDECPPTAHSCAKAAADSSEFDEPHENPYECGPFLRKDCRGGSLHTTAGCPTGYTCIEGNLCSGPIPETLRFQITSPPKPQGGNTVTSLMLAPQINIAVEAPKAVNQVVIQVFNPAGSKIFENACTPQEGTCGVWWEPIVPHRRCGATAVSGNANLCIPDADCSQCFDPSGESVCSTAMYSDAACTQACTEVGCGTLAGTFRIEAKGYDSGSPLNGMTDTTRVCFDCGPTASFTITAKTGQAVECSAGVFAPPASSQSGVATVTLDASGSGSMGATEMGSFTWRDNGTDIVGNLFQSSLDASLVLGQHTITLTVRDASTTPQTLSQTITVVNACP